MGRKAKGHGCSAQLQEGKWRDNAHAQVLAELDWDMLVKLLTISLESFISEGWAASCRESAGL